MRKYFDLVLNNQGQPIAGAVVTVRLAGTLTSATLFEDEGIIPKANPVTTDSGGLYWFYVDNGLYDLVIQALNFATITLTNVLIEDAVTITDLSNSTDVTKGDALVSGKRTDTGAVAFTLHEYNENRPINVKTDFGAVGDGVTNDRSAFASADATGKTVYVPDGVYNFGTSLAATSASWVISPGATFNGTGSFTYQSGFWTDDSPSAKVFRLRDRVWVGDAVDQSGAQSPGISKTWVGYEANGNMTYFDSRSQMGVYSTNGGIALATASRSSDNARTGELNTIGHGSYVVNDNTNAADKKTVWAFYGHSFQSEANKFTAGMELDVCSVQTLAGVTPYSMSPTGATACAWLGVGGEAAQGLISGGSGATLTNVSCAVGIINSATAAAGNRYEKGIVFQATSINGTDGTTGTGIAVEMAKGHEIAWKYSSGANAFGGKIRSDVTSAADHQRIIFENGLFKIKGVQADLTTEVDLFAVATHATAVNFLKANAAATGSPPVLESSGTDTNIALVFSSKGTGSINFRTRSSGLTQFQIVDVVSSVNNLQIGGSATGAGPYISATGSDTDINILLTPKGTGVIKSVRPVWILSGTAIPAGGTAGEGLMVSSTTNFGVFFGSGAPSLSAAKGSLYLRSDGTTTNNRAYINTDGATTWTALTTVA